MPIRDYQNLKAQLLITFDILNRCNTLEISINNYKILINRWIPKVRVRGDSTKVGSKVTPQEKLIFPQNINEFNEFSDLDNSDDF